jgi:hypothetical protein
LKISIGSVVRERKGDYMHLQQFMAVM